MIAATITLRDYRLRRQSGTLVTNSRESPDQPQCLRDVMSDDAGQDLRERDVSQHGAIGWRFVPGIPGVEVLAVAATAESVSTIRRVNCPIGSFC